jgi:hypothetical protein
VLLDPLDLGSGMGKNQRSGSRMNIPDHIYFLELRHHNYGLKYLNSLMRIRNGKILYLGSVNSLMRIRDGKILDPGWKNYYPGSGIFLT